MDGLLLDTERLYLSAYRAARDLMGLPPDDALFMSLVGMNSTRSAQVLADGLGNADADAFSAHWDAGVTERMKTDIRPKPGVADLAAHLKKIGMPYIIATSTKTDYAHRNLGRAGIGTYFPDVIGGDQVSRSKPAPDIYLAATRALGLAPHHCAGFEDSPNGVRAAHTAGLITVQVPDVVPPSDDLLALGHHVADDLLAGAQHLGLIDAATRKAFVSRGSGAS